MCRLKRLGISGILRIHAFISKDFKNFKRHCSNWSKIKAGVPKGLILVPLSLLVYIFYLPDEVTANAKFFAYDASLFSVAHGSTVSSVSLNNVLFKFSQWT